MSNQQAKATLRYPQHSSGRALSLPSTAAACLITVGLVLATKSQQGLPPAQASLPEQPPTEIVGFEMPTQDRHRLDFFGQPLPKGAVARMGILQFTPNVVPCDVDVLPDRKRVVSIYTSIIGGSRFQPGPGIRLWDGATGKDLGRFGFEFIGRLVLSADGQRLAETYRVRRPLQAQERRPAQPFHGMLGAQYVVHDDFVRVRNTTTFQAERRFPGRSPVALSQDGKLLALSQWARSPQRLKFVADTDKEANKSSADGKGASEPEECVGIYEVDTGKRLQSIRGKVEFMAFSPDGKFLAAARDWTDLQKSFVGLYSVAGGAEIRVWKDLGAYPNYLVFSADGKRLIAFAGYPHDQQWCWEVATGKLLWRLPPGNRNEFSVGSVALSPDGRLLASVWRWDILLQDAMTGKELRRLASGWRSGSCRLAFAADGKSLLLAGDERIVRRWDLSTGRELLQPGGHLRGLSALAVSPDGTTLVSAGESIHWWDLATGKERRTLTGETTLFDGLAFTADGKKVVTLDRHRAYHLWPLQAGEATLLAELQPDDRAAFSRDARQMARAERGAVRIVDISKGKEVRSWSGLPEAVPKGLLFSDDGSKLAFKDVRGTFWIWSVADARQICRLPAFLPWEDVAFRGGDQCGFPFFFSADGRLLLVRSEDYKINIVNPVTGKLVQKFQRNVDELHCLALSPDGKTLATVGRDDKIVLWEVATGNKRHTIAALAWGADGERHGHLAGITCLTFSPDGRFLISGSEDCTALVWDLARLGNPGG